MEESENVSSPSDAIADGSVAFGGGRDPTATTYHLPTCAALTFLLLLIISEVDLNTQKWTYKTYVDNLLRMA